MEPFQIRAEEILRRSPPPCIGAEIGVATGRTSQELLRHSGVRLIMVDSWLGNLAQSAEYIATGDGHALYTQGEQDLHMKAAFEDTDFAAARRTVYRMKSHDAAELVEDGSLDFVFIDADHSEPGCYLDIQCWLPKVRKGGVIGGHDYLYPLLPGVRAAVDRAAEENGWKIETGGNFTWFARL